MSHFTKITKLQKFKIYPPDGSVQNAPPLYNQLVAQARTHYHTPLKSSIPINGCNAAQQYYRNQSLLPAMVARQPARNILNSPR